jgi:hypothetical protein
MHARRSLLACAILGAMTGTLAAPAAARDTIGVYRNWAAFRDFRPHHCFAISEPVSGRSKQRPFAAVTTWPTMGVRAQVHIHLSRKKLRGAPVFLAIGEHRFPLVAGGADAWARNPRLDAAIVAAMRSGSSMSVETRGQNGKGFADVYRLRGAATAIDAATLACARLL